MGVDKVTIYLPDVYDIFEIALKCACSFLSPLLIENCRYPFSTQQYITVDIRFQRSNIYIYIYIHMVWICADLIYWADLYRRVMRKLENYTQQPFLPEARIGLRVFSLPASVRPSPSLSGRLLITHHPFKLVSPNLETIGVKDLG